jgi:hypothetical protein
MTISTTCNIGYKLCYIDESSYTSSDSVAYAYTSEYSYTSADTNLMIYLRVITKEEEKSKTTWIPNFSSKRKRRRKKTYPYFKNKIKPKLVWNYKLKNHSTIFSN